MLRGLSDTLGSIPPHAVPLVVVLEPPPSEPSDSLPYNSRPSPLVVDMEPPRKDSKLVGSEGEALSTPGTTIAPHVRGNPSIDPLGGEVSDPGFRAAPRRLTVCGIGCCFPVGAGSVHGAGESGDAR